MWSGAKESLEAGMRNVAFLRTPVEWVASCFAPGEVDEIWLTFPDPQMKKRGKRLTSAAFMERYGRMLRPGGLVHLKTDSRFLYTYTTEMIRANGLPLLRATDNLYGSGPAGDILSIQTSYEQQWLQRGMAIKYLCFALEARESFAEPGVEIAMDDYRSFNRSKRSALSSAK
jgi:tRNA (guanine-N7-)-methyltransferase